jgi:hypothetical protein
MHSNNSSLEADAIGGDMLGGGAGGVKLGGDARPAGGYDELGPLGGGELGPLGGG